MSNKTIAIIEFNEYDGQRSKFSEMYFETKLHAERYLKGNGYQPDDIFGWKKDYFYSAKIHMETLHLGDGEEWRIIDTREDENSKRNN